MPGRDIDDSSDPVARAAAEQAATLAPAAAMEDLERRLEQTRRALDAALSEVESWRQAALIGAATAAAGALLFLWPS